jgi:hypothetical protein
MPSIPRILAALAAALVLAAAPARAQAPAPVLPDTGLTVVLLTMGQGDFVWEKFGHNALWIHDPAAGTDNVYNYGVFDFKAPDYWPRFLKGNWLYMLGVYDIRNTIYQYQYFNRAMWAQELNLTPAQKREVQAFLVNNALPPNAEYLYDYYRDNCSTRIRDVLDRVVGGRLRAATADSLTGTTFRWHSERLIADDQPAYFGLAGGLGPAADREINAWEEMFLPFKVQQQVRRIRVPDASGREVPLVAREWTMLQAPGRTAERPAPPLRTPFYLLAGLLIAGTLFLLGSRAAAGAAVDDDQPPDRLPQREPAAAFAPGAAAGAAGAVPGLRRPLGRPSRAPAGDGRGGAVAAGLRAAGAARAGPAQRADHRHGAAGEPGPRVDRAGAGRAHPAPRRARRPPRPRAPARRGVNLHHAKRPGVALRGPVPGLLHQHASRQPRPQKTVIPSEERARNLLAHGRCTATDPDPSRPTILQPPLMSGTRRRRSQPCPDLTS